jgi:hypothetical protein
VDFDHCQHPVPDEFEAGQHEADAEEPSGGRIPLRNDEAPERVVWQRTDQWTPFVAAGRDGIV